MKEQATVQPGKAASTRPPGRVLQRAAIQPVSDDVAAPIVQAVLDTPGQPLDTPTRAFMEPRFGQDFSRVPVGTAAAGRPSHLAIGRAGDRYEQEAERAAERVLGGGVAADPARAPYDLTRVRIHADPAAAASARAVGARAFTVGEHIVFGAGHYRPTTGAGRRLLAHELAHVVQQQGAPARGTLQRAPDGEPQAPSRIGMTVSLSGIAFEVPDDFTFKRGRKTPQLLAIVLQRLLGPQYKPGLEREVERKLSKTKFKRYGGFKAGASAKGGERIGLIMLKLEPAMVLIQFLKSKKLQVQLSKQQEDLLTLAVANLNLSVDFFQSIKAAGLKLPKWYSRDIFDQEMAQHGKLLREYADQLAKARGGDQQARQAGMETVNKVVDALYGPAMVLEAVRRDVSLAANPETSGIYGALWRLPRAKKGETPKVTTPPTKLHSPSAAVLFLGYMRTQPQLMQNAKVDAKARLELVKRYARYTQQMMFQGTPSKGGDEQIRDQPATANYPAFPSTLSAIPPLPPPLFDAALGTDYRFQMDAQFPSVYEALGRYAFKWERVRVPDDKIGQPIDVSKLKGEEVSMGEVAAVRFSRDTAYAKADIKRVLGEIKSDIGPPGVGALELVSANAILRYIGTGIRLGLTIMTMPLNQKLIVFPSPGLYVVRSFMSQVREGNEEVVRVPSVAYLPVLARNPDEMAAGGVKATLTAREKAQQRIKDIQAKLNKTDLEADERKRLEAELKALQTATEPLGKRLESRRAELAKQIADIKSGARKGDLETATKAQENLDKIIALRAKRKIGNAELLTARFVSDLGQTIPLTLEVVDRTARKGHAAVYISDVTTPKSGDAKGSGKTRDDAIADGVRRLLESIHGYGRGRVAIALGGGIRTIRIEASLGSLLSESIENVTTVLSVAAIAAAPFTGGASLSFLVPLGLVGAIPSAYRVVEKVEAGTFDLSLEDALDVVNIAGSLIGIGRMGATSLRMMRLGEAMLIVGFGVDAAGGILMGAQFITQIDALSKLPPGERSAALLMLIGQTMISAGVTVGGALAERAQQMHAEVEGGKLKGLADEKPAGATGEPHATAGEPGGTPAEPGGKKPAAPAADLFDKARVDGEMQRLGKMDAASEAHIRADEPLRKALTDQPLAAAALKRCASPCYPTNIKPEQVARLDRLLSRLKETGTYNEAALKEYLYNRRDDLSRAISQIEGTKNAGDLNAWLEFYNTRGEKDIKKLPAQGSPAELLAQRDRAHDFGVERGRAQASTDGMSQVGFDNPFERYGRYGQGFDDVMKKGPSLDKGDVYIVEYKGGDAVLSKGQMELDWVLGNIRRLYTEGGPAGRQWARTLAKALREGRLKGVAYSTPVVDGSPQPTVTIKEWAYQPTNLYFP